MAVYQISRIQHRRGTAAELPDALADGEIGVTTDTGEVFVGASDHPAVSSRTSYPYQNIKVITELDVQRTITGDVYYHGALAGTLLPNGTTASIVPLFANGTCDFATYEISFSSQDRTKKVMAILTVCVHPTDPNQSVVTVTPGSICYMGWDSTNHPLSNQIKLSSLDDTGQNTGVTWLNVANNFAVGDLIVSVSGREWSNVQIPIAPPTVG